MRKLTISQYRSFRDKGQKLDVRQVSWDEVIETLSDSKQTPETFEEFMAADKDERLRIKDCGYFVGGRFDPPIRLKKNIKGRSLATLDLDHLSFCDVELIKETFGKYAYLIHSTHSHSEDEPRIRLVIPLSRDVTPLEYEPLCRMIAKRMGMEYFDDSTYQSFRVMFLPSHAVDGDVVFEVNEGQWLDPSKVLDVYEDWGDFVEWPRSSREEKKGIREAVSEAGDPFEKPGYIGAFNRAYPIDEAIETFELPYEESGTGDNRYSYMGGESADGAVLYPEQGYLFSHHATDPANGNNCAWDLVRLHKFGALDTEEDRKLPIAKQPSQIAMTEFVESLANVRAQLFDNAPEVHAEDEFEDVVDSDTGETVKVKKAKVVTDFHSLVADLQDWTHSDKEDGELFLSQENWDDLVMRASMGFSRGILSESELDVFAGHMRLAHWTGEKVAKVPVVREIKLRAKQLKKKGSEDDVKDIQIAFLQNFEKRFYHNGEWLRRTGGQFWSYCGTHWEKVSDEQVAGKMVKSISDLRESTEDKKELRALIAAVGEAQTSAIWSSLKNMYQSIKTEWTSEVAEDPRDPVGLMRTDVDPAINCLDGEIRFRDGKYRMTKHRPGSLFTNVIPVHFDKEGDTPMWDEFCRTAFQLDSDPADMQRHLEELCGYILNQSRHLRCWALLYGPTGSGKSTVGKILTEMMGDAAKPMNMSNYGGENSHASAGLVGTQLLYDDDYESKQNGKTIQLNAGFVKTASEEKKIGANPKGKDEISIILRLVLMICSNNPPQTSDTSGALYDRALVIPFSHSIPRSERDPLYVKKMRETEFPALLARFVRGAARLLHRGDWLFPEGCTQAWQRWIAQSNTLPSFLGDCYVADPKGVVHTTDLEATYKKYLEVQGVRFGLTRNRLYTEVDNLWGARQRDNTRGEEWRGFSFIPDSLDDRSFGERDSVDDDFDDVEEWDT